MKNRTTFLIATLALLLLSSVTFAVSPIKGSVAYHNPQNTPLPSVNVELWSANGQILIETTTTSNAGKYTFYNIPYGNYLIKSSNIPLDPGGYDEADGQLIWDHAHNIITLTGIEFLAADLNHNGQVNMQDYNIFMDYWNSGFQPEWVFQDLPIDHNGTKTNVPTMSGSSSGDVNGTFVPTTRNEVLVNTDYIGKKFTKDFSIEVFAKDLESAASMGLIINYPSSVTIQSIVSPLGDLTNAKIQESSIVMNWVNNNYNDKNLNSSEPVAIIYATTNSNYTGGDIKFNVSNKTNFLKGGEVVRPKLSLTYLSVSGSDYLSHCYPNPANGTTTVYFNVPTDSKTSIDIYNLSGQLVKTVLNEEMSQGNHSVEINLSDLREGVYFCNLRTNGNSVNQTKRLVVVH